MKSFFDFIGLPEATSSPCRPELDTRKAEVPCLAPTSIRRFPRRQLFSHHRELAYGLEGLGAGAGQCRNAEGPVHRRTDWSAFDEIMETREVKRSDGDLSQGGGRKYDRRWSLELEMLKQLAKKQSSCSQHGRI